LSKERFEKRVVSGGRVTIPDAIRKDLGIREGDIVDVKIIEVEHTDPYEGDDDPGAAGAAAEREKAAA